MDEFTQAEIETFRKILLKREIAKRVIENDRHEKYIEESMHKTQEYTEMSDEKVTVLLAAEYR